MADPRFYAKIDVGYLTNPKISDLIDDNPRAITMHLAAILYCRQHIKDGAFPIRQAVRIASASYCGSVCESHSEPQCDFCAAVSAGLFDRIDGRTARVHDYLEHQDSPEHILRRKKAGKAGAAARWGTSQGTSMTDPEDATRTASTNATRYAEERRGEERKEEPPYPPEGESADADVSGVTLSLIEPPATTDRFDEFYDLFAGRKKSPAKAKSAWKRALRKKGVDADLLIERGSAYVTAQKSNGKFPEYTKYPENWLNDEMWEADLPGTATPTASAEPFQRRSKAFIPVCPTCKAPPEHIHDPECPDQEWRPPTEEGVGS